MSVDISSPREPTIRGRRVESPLQVAQFVDEVLKRHMRSALGPQDTALMERANKRLMTHATVGLTVGSMCGTLLAFRGRWNAARSVVSNATRQSSSTAKSFYPTLSNNAASSSQQQATEPSRRDRVWFIAKGLGFGIFGALVGTQIGVWTGTKSAQRVIVDSGRERDIARNLTAAMKAAVQEIEANSTGLEIKNHALMKSASKFSDMPGGGDWGDVEEDSQLMGTLPTASTSSPSSSSSASSSEQKPISRWDELRQQNATPPSTWDAIRERSARNNIPGPSIDRGDHAARASETSGGDNNASMTEDERRRKFDELMDKERRGGDDGFSPDRSSR
ncbi:hypothetical protein OIO90_005656 [Microbotryomycetes sp. JL221]|nr:hypothetical protein OIO90_005656 [Microbotryomycetes sp. JL221]